MIVVSLGPTWCVPNVCPVVSSVNVKVPPSKVAPSVLLTDAVKVTCWVERAGSRLEVSDVLVATPTVKVAGALELAAKSPSPMNAATTE